jgi:predicted TIM-barrel fold metal-dependent hydrolase
MLIDADGHVVEPPTLWAEYTDPAWREKVTVGRDEHGDVSCIRLGREIVQNLSGFNTPSRPYGAGDSFVPGGLKAGNVCGRTLAESHPGGFDPLARLAVHDAEGIDSAVLFPTYGLMLGGLADVAVAEAGCRALNRWLGEYYCGAAPDELYGIASLPSQDPTIAATELRRSVVSYGFVGGLLRSNCAREGRTLADPSFDVLWATASDLGVPICFHNALNTDLPYAGAERVRTFPMSHVIVHPVEHMLAFATLVEGGVFDRHPGLRAGFMESGCGWAPFWIDRMDEHLENLGWMIDPQPARDPAEIFATQCAISAEGDEPMIDYVQRRLGEEAVVWASDFPHFDASFPLTAITRRPDLTASALDGLVRRGAVRFYGLDEHAIERSVGRRRRVNGGRTSPHA